MALFQIRRGNNSSKGTLSYGEPYFNSDLQSVEFGASGSNEQVTLVKLNTGASSDAKWSGSLANSGSLSLTGDITASNAYFRGDVYISGSIQLGDNAVQDHITVIADFNSDLVPSQNTQYNLGSGGKYWKRLYATTASIDEITALGNVTNFSSSLDSRIVTLNSTTDNLNSYTASVNAKIAAIHTATASLDVFTSSINTTIKSKMNTDGVISGSSQVLFTSINGYPTYSSSVDTFVNATSGVLSSSVAAYNAVQDSKINSTTSSFQSYSASINSFTASVNSTTSSQNSRLNSLEINSGSLLIFSQSVANGIEFTGSNVTIKGNLLVKGTQTSVNSTTVDIGDNIISLNGTGATNAGIIVRDVTGGTTTSGSLLWDTTNDYWKAGPNGAEQRLIRETEYNSYTSSNDSRVSSLESESGSIRTTLNTYSSSINSYTASNNTNINAIHTSTSSLNSFTSSINTTIKSKLNTDNVLSGSSQIDITATIGYTTFSSSIAAINSAEEVRLVNLENVSGTFFAYTASNDSTNETQNFKLGALETTSASLNTFTSSANSRLNSLEIESGSIRGTHNTFTSSYLVASSSFNTRVGNLETFSSSLNASYVSEVEFGLWSGSIHSFSASVNSTTSSFKGRLNSLESTTASLNIATASLFVSSSQLTASFSQMSQSFNYRINQFVAGTGFLDAFTFENYSSSFENWTSSLHSYTASINSKLTAIHTATASLNSYTSSQNTHNSAVNIATASLNTSTASLNSYTASNTTNINAIHTSTSSLNTSTASLNSYTASNTNNINAIHTFTASVNLNNAALNIASASLNTYSSSLKAAIETTGSNVTIIGNLLVKGTTTQVDSTTLNIGDNIIQLNAAGTANGGLVVRDATGGSTLSGSLLWDVTNDYWKAGVEGSEQRIVLNDEFTSFSSSVNLTTASLNGKTGSYATTGSNQFKADQTISGSLIVTQNLTVLGSSSITYITSSQLNVDISTIAVNVNEPSERFGGLVIYDSGSSAATASFLWDSLHNRFIYQNVDGASYNGAMFISGPRNTGSLGNELTLTNGRIPKSIGGDHIGDSIIFETSSAIGISGSLVVTGSILATGTTLVSGSSQIDLTATTNYASGIKTQLNSNNVISGSSQILGGSGLVSGSSQIDLTGTTNYVSGIKTRLNSESVVSGSSQIDITSTTGFGTYINQPLLTTSVVTFAGVLSNGNLGVTGSISATADIVAYASSDKRYKNNIVLISDAVSKVSKLNGVTWEWNDEVDDVTKQSPKTGLIAQEVKEVLPEVVNERENGFLGLDYSKMVGLLVEAIKEQQNTIEDLKARLNKLENGE